MNRSRFIAGALLLFTSVSCLATDFRTVNVPAAVLFDAPSQKGSKLYVAPRGMPVEVVLSYGEWVKVRDYTGDLAWTEVKNLAAKHGDVVVRNANAKLRAAADEKSEVLLTAERGVLLELVEPSANGWVHVRHKDGITGYIKSTDVWGI